jgi:hypothetical protein
MVHCRQGMLQGAFLNIAAPSDDEDAALYSCRNGLTPFPSWDGPGTTGKAAGNFRSIARKFQSAAGNELRQRHAPTRLQSNARRIAVGEFHARILKRALHHGERCPVRRDLAILKIPHGRTAHLRRFAKLALGPIEQSAGGTALCGRHAARLSAAFRKRKSLRKSLTATLKAGLTTTTGKAVHHG